MESNSIATKATRVHNMDQLPRGRHSLSREQVFSSQRGRMMRAVAVVVAEKGYGATVVENIVSVAGVSRKTFYEHFTDVQDCFLEAYADFGDSILDEVGQEVAVTDQVGSAQMMVAYRTIFMVVKEDRELAQAFWLDAISAGPKYLATRERIFGGFAEMLRDGYAQRRQSEPHLPEPLEGSYAAVIGMMTEMVVVGLLSGRDLDVDAMVEDAVTFTLAILQARPLPAEG